jgi:ribosome maturation factor RimP
MTQKSFSSLPAELAELAELAIPLAQSMGLTLWGIEALFSSRSVLRVFVEGGESSGPGGEGGVTVGQCAELARLLGLALDVEDFLPGAYTLEVSSPGLERRFFTAGQLAGAQGRKVAVTLLLPLTDFPGRRRFRGILESVPDRSSATPKLPGNSPDSRTFPDSPAESLFGLRAEVPARPGEEAPLVCFAFSQVKKATLVHTPPEKIPPGKGGKKQPAQKKAAALQPKNTAIDTE